MAKSSRDQSMNAVQLLVVVGSFIALCITGGLLVAATAIPVVASAGTAANAGLALFDDLPTKIDFTRPSEQSVIRAADGSEIARFYAENRIVVNSESISPLIKNAVIAIEDERFMQHNGIDAQGIIGAALNNFTGGNLAGGSSITQQYVKNALIEEGRIANDAEQINQATATTITRKLNEARYAIAIERQRTKDEILTGYLNIAQFGPSQWGVEAASRYFFSVPASQVTLEQAAMLAGITQAPNRWNPIKNPEDAKARRDVVLSQMARLGYITKEQRDAAIAVPIQQMLHVTPTPNGCAAAGNAAYFCETVVNDVLNSSSFGKSRDERVRLLYRGGLEITTTLDPKAQANAYQSLTANLPVNDPSAIQGSLSAIEPGTGKILAMVQNTNYGDASKEDPHATKLNLNVGRLRGGGGGFQAGSTFKIFTLAQWFNAGKSASDQVNTSEQTYPASAWKISCMPSATGSFGPKNNEGEGGGMRSVAETTARSLNAGFAAMATQLDLCDITKIAKDMGVERGSLATAKDAAELAQLGAKEGEPLPLVPNPSMILGTNTVTPLSMANAVATLAADGKMCTPISFTEIKDRSGKTLAKQDPSCRQTIEAEVARRTTAVLQQVISARYGSGTGARLAGGRPVAGKTGTANNAYHAWFVGYTPQLATAVWTGHMSGNEPMLNVVVNGRRYSVLYGGTVAASAFADFNNAFLAGKPHESFKSPSAPVTTTVEEDPAKKAQEQTPDQQNQPVGVPNVVGQEMNQAAKALRAAGYKVTASGAWSDKPKNTVVATNPAPGTAITPGASIDIVVSQGPKP
ncbi:penicillin-binding protein [Arcanobacterium bovis]|uniref:PASTA domain-containing protein n=1 Tax=Arcanobacterium bovis TaxID=2529275 RepID=A0A4Q9V4G3_9ACTO|nr:penicillin-binding protein [Arcanobacterium bovis]TBW23887.1 PASTA domain-containing protein [Arcanobacterium bovis]